MRATESLATTAQAVLLHTLGERRCDDSSHVNLYLSNLPFGGCISARDRNIIEGTQWKEKQMSTERAPINVILRGGQSGDHIAVMDNVVGAGFSGPPLHHHDFDETFYVLEGELTFRLEDEIFTRGQGELAFAPRNVAHTFANLSGAEARTLIVCTPAGFERYFDRMAAERAGVDPPPEARKPWPEVTTVGPRIGERPDDGQ